MTAAHGPSGCGAPGAGRTRPPRWREKGWTPFHSTGHPIALIAAPTWSAPDGDPVLAFATADPGGHPFDTAPIALLTPGRAQELVTAVQAWLASLPRSGA